MIKKMGLTFSVMAVIALASCGGTSSSTVDGSIAKLDSALSSLNAIISDPTNITTGFQVPVTLANQITAAWTSEEPGVLSFGTQATGGFINVTVNRPAKGDGDATFDITAVLSRKSDLSEDILTRTWIKEVTVKENTVEEVSIDNVEDILALLDPALDNNLNVTLNDMTIIARSNDEAFAYDGTGTIQLYGIPSTLTAGKVYTVSGKINWFFGVWEIDNVTATEQVGATPQYPNKETIPSVKSKIDQLAASGEHQYAKVADGNFEPIYAAVTGKIYKLPQDTGNYNTWIMDTEVSTYVPGTSTVPANALMVYYKTSDFETLRQYDGITVTIDVIIYTYRSNNLAFAVYYVGGPEGIEATLTPIQAQTIDAESLTIPASITENTTLDLRTTGVNGSTIEWASSNEVVINSTSGSVVVPSTAEVVTLTATVKMDGLTNIVKPFEVAVGALENKALSTIETLAKGAKAYSEVKVLWKNPSTSSALKDKSFVVGDATGFAYIVNDVALLTLTVGDFVGISYEINLFESSGNSLVQLTKVKIITPTGAEPTMPIATSWNLSDVSDFFALPKFGVRFVTINNLIGFDSGFGGANAYLQGLGKTRSVRTDGAPSTLVDKKFNATGFIIGKNATQIQFHNDPANYTAGTTLTDAEKLAISAERFNAPTANESVTSNLTLQTTTLYATVTWTSSNTNVISNTGVVARPAIGQSDVSLTLSYVLNVGNESTQPVEIPFTVKAQEANPNQYSSDLFINFYLEGNVGNRKVLAVYNNTGSTVDLSNYKIGSVNNLTAAPVAANILGPALTGTLEHGKAVIVYHGEMVDSTKTSYIESFKTMIDTLPTGNRSFAFNYGFNGTQGDVMAVAKNIGGTWTFVDFLGEWNTAVASGTSAAWEVSYTKDLSLFRKATVVDPRTTVDWSEWEVATVHTFDSRVYTWK
jgi:hypothetical protein